jgi:hypothetical protein
VIVVSTVWGTAYTEGGIWKRDFVCGEINWAAVPRAVTLVFAATSVGLLSLCFLLPVQRIGFQVILLETHSVP